MIAKLIEIRDAMTFIPAMAVWLKPSDLAEEFLLAREGYERGSQGNFVLLIWLARGRSEYDPEVWASRTLQVAHHYVIDHFCEINSGDVVDVEFILGLRDEPKISERLEVGS